MQRQVSLALLSLSLGGLGCSGDEEVLPVELVRFEVVGGATEVQAGESVMLSWELKNAATVSISATPGGDLEGVSGNSGTVSSGPLDQPTTFKLTATGADGSRVSSDAITIQVRGIRISSFTATPAMISPGESSTLEWSVGGDPPTEVTVTDGDGAEVYSGVEPTGTVDVSPTSSETYTLSVTAESGTDEATVEVMVEDVAPTIQSFTAVETTVALNEFAELRWVTVGAYEVQVLKDDTVRRPWNTQGAARGSVSIEVDAPSVDFTLQARTESGLMSEETITVTAIAVPAITQFDLSPAGYTQASTVATVTWDTMNTDRTILQVDGAADSSFPGTASGTYDFTVTGAPDITLIAQNAVGEDRQTQQIQLGFDDPEPNDSSTTAIALAGDGIAVRGTVTSSDTDVYAVMVPEGARIDAIVGYNEDSMSCSFDTVLDVYDSDGTTLLGSVDDTNLPQINPCSRLHPAAHPFADTLPAGTYYVAVRGGSPQATGTYSLKLKVTGPGTPLSNVTKTPVGNPTWTIEDVHQVSILAGNQNNMFRFLNDNINAIFNPVHNLTGFIGGIHPAFEPVQPVDRDYSTILSALFDVAGYTSKSTFTREEYEADNGVLIAFTLVPGAGAPVEDSYDFASGPVLQTELFPMNVAFSITRNGVEFWPENTFTFDGYHQFMPPVPGSGTSHRVFAAVVLDALAAMGEDAAGTYENTFTILGANGDGWTVTVPFTVTP